MVLQPGLEQLEGSLHITVLAVHFGERGEGQAVRILGVPALEFLDLAKCHPDPGVAGLRLEGKAVVQGTRGSVVRVAIRGPGVNC